MFAQECVLHYTAGTMFYCQVRVGDNFNRVSQLQALCKFTFPSFKTGEHLLFFWEFYSEAHLIHPLKCIENRKCEV